MDIQKLRDQIADKAEAARALGSKDSLTAEESKQFDALLKEISQLKLDLDNKMKLEGLDSPHDAAAVAAQASTITITNQPPVYRNIGEQMLDVQAMTLDSREAPKARDRYTQVVNAASGASLATGADGGYLVETDKATGIMTTAIETGVFSSRCTQQGISANADSFSYMAADDRDRSTGKRNGMQVYRKGEVDTMVSSGKAALKEREIRVEDMYGLVYVTNRMLRDAPAMASYTQRCLREQFAFKLDYEIWQGNGAGQCLGIMNSGLPVTVAKESGQAADTVVAENVVKMLSRFGGNIASSAWFINQDVLPTLPFMKIGDTPIFVPGGSFANAPFGVLLGRPIIPVEFCKTLGDKGDILLADWSEYLLVTKGGMEEAQSIHVKFVTDEMAFRFITRNNGQPMHDAPITPLNGSNTLSPFVMLAERA